MLLSFGVRGSLFVIPLQFVITTNLCHGRPSWALVLSHIATNVDKLFQSTRDPLPRYLHWIACHPSGVRPIRSIPLSCFETKAWGYSVLYSCNNQTQVYPPDPISQSLQKHSQISPFLFLLSRSLMSSTLLTDLLNSYSISLTISSKILIPSLDKHLLMTALCILPVCVPY